MKCTMKRQIEIVVINVTVDLVFNFFKIFGIVDGTLWNCTHFSSGPVATTFFFVETGVRFAFGVVSPVNVATEEVEEE